MNADRRRKPFAARASLLVVCSVMFAGAVDAAVFVDKADVTRARRVTPPAIEKRCWTEWEQTAVDATTPAPSQAASIPSLFSGFRFVATSSASAEISGANTAVKPIEHCIEEPGAAKPAYWEVEYTYRGMPFTTRLNYDPGPQISVRVVVDPQP